MVFDRVHPSDLPEVQATLHRCYYSTLEQSCQFRAIVDDSERWFRAVARPIQSSQGKLVWHGMLNNIDDLKHLEKELAHLSITDELTGLFNRRYLAQTLNESIELYRRYKTPFSVISLDIDHFKQINDAHGHLVGDPVLIEISSLMQCRLRSTDIIGRMSSKEFLAVLPNTSEQEALRVAENLRQTISQAEFLNEEDTPFGVTASGGVLEITDDTATVEDLLRRSDRLLYEAKESGRNMVLASQASPKTEAH